MPEKWPDIKGREKNGTQAHTQRGKGSHQNFTSFRIQYICGETREK